MNSAGSALLRLDSSRPRPQQSCGCSRATRREVYAAAGGDQRGPAMRRFPDSQATPNSSLNGSVIGGSRPGAHANISKLVASYGLAHDPLMRVMGACAKLCTLATVVNGDSEVWRILQQPFAPA
jgi:hypothetical protein